MPKPYSTDLRERAVEAVESGASRREVAEIFRVGVSSVIRWCQRWSETGNAALHGHDLPRESHMTIHIGRQRFIAKLGRGSRVAAHGARAAAGNAGDWDSQRRIPCAVRAIHGGDPPGV